MTKIHIKNMVCNRCVSVVTNELQSLGMKVSHVGLGEAVLENVLTDEQHSMLKIAIEKHGFELLDDKKAKIIEQVKTLLIVLVHHNKEKKPGHMRYSDYLEKQIGMDYTSLSKLFSETEGVTIEHFLISQKVERIKELLIYDEYSVSEIALEMEYSSVAHLSAQFKKFTGSTPSEFKKLHAHNRKSLDKI
ncbi:MAG: AraC family transcriptional regulator [Bacteroidota bacterium]|nr:AraC family transcriptional regulator [Bacteroidota bacterium]